MMQWPLTTNRPIARRNASASCRGLSSCVTRDHDASQLLRHGWQLLPSLFCQTLQIKTLRNEKRRFFFLLILIAILLCV